MAGFQMQLPSHTSGPIGIVPPTPGPSDIGQEHPWAKMFSTGGALPTSSLGGSGHQGPPATPGAVFRNNGTFGGGSFSLPTRRASIPHQAGPLLPPSGTQHRPSPLGLNQKASSFEKSDPRKLKPILGSSSVPSAMKVASSPAMPNDLARYQALEPASLAEMLEDTAASPTTASPSGSSSLLVIDIRPSTSFYNGRIKSSINICAPSTLLKRPGVTVQRIEDEMLQSDSDRVKFERWKLGPMKQSDELAQEAADDESVISEGVSKIVVLDTDTANVAEAGRPNVGGGGPCLLGMLRKFDAAGYAGHLYWLVGGFQKFTARAGSPSSDAAADDLVESGPLDDDEADVGVAVNDPAETTASNGSVAAQQMQLQSADSRGAGRLSLPSHSSTRGPAHDKANARLSLVQAGRLPMDAFTDQTTTKQSDGKTSSRRATGSAAAANPFFDNIRQNRELAHGITEKVPLEVPADLTNQDKQQLPSFLQNLVEKEDEERATELATKFFEVEKAEQIRLMDTMRQHSIMGGSDPRAAPSPLRTVDSTPAEGGGQSQAPMQLSSVHCAVTASGDAKNQSDANFPFSIGSAVERGSENRYNNIWTYEHSRVRVEAVQNCPAVSEYLNASYVEPLRRFKSNRRYIATQAPLPSTFETFWNAIWQENSRVICMLTREFESGRVQSHNYWDATDGTQGMQWPSVQVKVLEERNLNGRGQVCQATKPTDDPAKEQAAVQSATTCNEPSFFSVGGSSTTNGEKRQPEVDYDDPTAPVIIHRRIQLSSVRFPQEAPRIIDQLQYVAWPDYSIPSDPEALLLYMDLANALQHQAQVQATSSMPSQSVSPRGQAAGGKGEAIGPLILHCSAGVGRTGTYIVIDSVLDVLRRERRAAKNLPPLDNWDNGTSSFSSMSAGADAEGDVEMTAASSLIKTPVSKTMSLPGTTTLDASFKSPQTPERSVSQSAALSSRGRVDGDEMTDTPTLASSFNFSSTPSRQHSLLRSTRKSLKRELSPSADMDLTEEASRANGIYNDASSSTSSLGGRITDHPSPRSTGARRGSSTLASPMTSTHGHHYSNDSTGSTNSTSSRLGRGGSMRMRRSRSASSDGSSEAGATIEQDSLADPSSPTPFASSSSVDRTPVRGGASSGSGAGWSHIGIRQPEGMDTPSRAMDGMSLDFQFGAANLPASAFPLALPPGSAVDYNNNVGSGPIRRSSIARTTHSSASEARSSPVPPIYSPPTANNATAVPMTATLSSPASIVPPPIGGTPAAEATKAVDGANIGEVDLVRYATDVAREQRMSSVQTQRQYVFCYLTILKGVLREVRREQQDS